MKGRVHSFESFGAVDGPGIRFIVFLQGCHLQCKYCHNRDTWSEEVGTWYETDEVIEKALRVKPYMDFSKGGGITASGGEPLLQVPFVTELFQKAKENGMTTCLDTSGSVEITDDVKKLLSLTDTVLLDIKHIDEEKCIKLTGHSNKNELAFARYLSDNGIDMWIRQVLVPTYTDDENDLKRTREFIDTLKTVKRVEVLPYHDFGKSKWIDMGLAYPLEGVPIPTNEQVDKARKILGAV
jgi:pyruvate formate lyase activating enzyme